MPEGAPNMGDEPPVVGEPASQPHQAAVVGEPPEEVVPVLGEPVPLANGLQKDQQPVSSEESTINGGHKESSESPSQSSDAPPSTGSTEGSPNPAMAPAAEEHITSDAQEIPGSTHGTNEANPDADMSEDVEVTHLTDVPSEPPSPESEIPTENPFSVLDEGSEETDLKISDEGEEPAGGPSETGEKAVSAAPPVDGDTKKGLGVEGEATESPVAREETAKSLGASTTDSQGGTSEEPSKREVEEKNVNNDMSGDNKTPEPSEADAETKGSSVGGSSPEEATVEATDSVDNSVSTGKVGETMEEHPVESGSTLRMEWQAKSGEAVHPEVKPASSKQGEDVDASAEAPPSEAKQVVSREAALSDVPSSDKVSSKEGQDQASSLVQSDKDVSAEAFPKESSGLRAIAMEAGNGDQAPLDDPSLGENGFQHGKDGLPVEKEQGLTKDDMERVEAKEKPSSRFNLPMIFTTLAVAVVGVAVASMSRSRQ